MQKSCLKFPVEFVRDVFGENDVLATTLRKVSGEESPRVLIVADMNVVQRNEGLGAKIGKYVSEHGIELADHPVVVAGGEKIKSDNLASVIRVAMAMLAAKLSKHDVVLAIGGGTLLDIAGYAASQVRGGVKLVRVPTTPAAIFDAAYAEFAAVNIGSVKDAMRVPSVPEAVVIDVGLAASVLDGVWRGGIGEVVRMAVAQDSALLKKLPKLIDEYCGRDLEVLDEVARAVYAVRAKKGSTDFALWAPLRLEAMSGYKLPHGYSVPIGICIELGYAVEKGHIAAKDRDMVVEMLAHSGALDGLRHSQHLLTQPDNVLLGIDSKCLVSGDGSLPVVVDLGKNKVDESPDREVYGKVIKETISIPAAQ